jgi:twitching motility two-component system response regulator PilG
MMAVNTELDCGQKTTPRQLLIELKQSKDGCNYFVRDKIRWSFYVKNGNLVYASHSLEGFERLERHLRGLSRSLPALDDKLRSQLRLMFDDPSDNAKYQVTSETLCSEYIALLWLVDENYLPKQMAGKLLARIIQEVVEAFLCLPDGEFIGKHYEHTLRETYCSLSVERVLEVVEQRLKAWYILGPTISSPYQCPYLVSQTAALNRMSHDAVHRLGRVLRGFNFCQLGSLLGKDPLAIASQLSPLVSDGAILLRDPLAPFDMLPRTYYLSPEVESKSPEIISEPLLEKNSESENDISQIVANQSVKTLKIVCIDDSESMLSIISSYLSTEDFEVTLIQDSMKALMKINSIRPDLILLDIGMPNVDGYQLCTLIRKSSIFKDIPIVMVTGNKGIIDRARARLAGATDYLTKPFMQADLLKMMMRHLM